MNKKKRMLQGALALGVIGVGVYMLLTNTWGTMPSVSGLGFLFAGLALWTPYCPGARLILGD
jgi:hypothetical protein